MECLQYEYEEGLMTYRAALRSKNLYGRYNANGYNPINGKELWDVKMPDRPMQPSEVMKAQAAMQKLEAVKLMKQRCFENGGMGGIRSFGSIVRQVAGEQGLMSKEQLFQALEMYGIKGFTEIQIQNIVEAFDTGNGSISCIDLLSALRGPINERRKALVGMAWQQLDVSNSK